MKKRRFKELSLRLHGQWEEWSLVGTPRAQLSAKAFQTMSFATMDLKNYLEWLWFLLKMTVVSVWLLCQVFAHIAHVMLGTALCWRWDSAFRVGHGVLELTSHCHSHRQGVCRQWVQWDRESGARNSPWLLGWVNLSCHASEILTSSKTFLHTDIFWDVKFLGMKDLLK